MIYLDNAGTTKVIGEIAELYKYYLTEEYYNPSAPYHQALILSKAIAEAKEKILRLIKGNGSIIFTSSGSESDNLALFGTKKPNGSRIIVSNSEHPAVFNTALELKQRGYDVVFTEVDNFGRVNIEQFEKNMTENTYLVSIMHVNNETGAINDIKRLCEIAKRINPKVIFHSDGVQAVGKIKVSVSDLGVDLYSFSGHKIHAPKGVGGLFVKSGINLKPMIFGGGQENNVRSSTENVAGIMCLTKALELAIANIEENFQKVSELRDIIKRSTDNEKIIAISNDDCSPYILCLALKNIRGEVMLHSLEKHGVLIGTGSACSSKKSHKRLPSILKLSSEYAEGIIRLSFCRFNTKDDIEYFINKINLEYSKLIKYARG